VLKRINKHPWTRT